MEACAWVRLSRHQLEQQIGVEMLHSNIKRDYPRSRARKAVLVLPLSLWKENMTLSFYGKKPLLSSVYTGADPKPLKSTQIFAWTSEDPESNLQPLAPAGMWKGRQNQVPCISHSSLPFCSPSQVRNSCTNSTQSGAISKSGQGTARVSDREREAGGRHDGKLVLQLCWVRIALTFPIWSLQNYL